VFLITVLNFIYIVFVLHHTWFWEFFSDFGHLDGCIHWD